MAAITASLVNELRQLTGAGMMQCKAALTEAEGDLQKAREILRIKLGKKAEGRLERQASEGAVFARISADRRIGVIIELNSETDFVARNDQFKALGQSLVEKLLSYAAGTVPADQDAFLADTMEEGKTVAAYINDAAAPIGEKVALGRFERFGAPEGNAVAAYVHNPGGSGDDGGRIGVLVELTGADADALSTLGREIALHIASSNPQYLAEGDVEPAMIEKEREIARAQAAEDPKMAGKPAQAIESMVNGRVRRFLEETVLLKQAYVRDPAKTVEAIVKETAGAGIVRFVRFKVGELQADQPAEEQA
ncbi:MAG: translation elongation factor Ts [Capsulimonadales bacterium]|nr:translation elongation factor Ts [Capsulimonadales bacterium]